MRDRLRRAFGIRRILVDGAQLAGLSSIAIAEPLFDLLGRNATFFTAHALTPREIVLFAVVLTLLPPALALLAEILVGLFDMRLRLALHVLILGGLGALFVVQAVKKATAELPGLPWLVAAVVSGAAIAAAYVWVRAFRIFLTVLAPAPIVFLVAFLFFSPVESLVRPAQAATRSGKVAARTPIVVVIWDEFPTTSLMNAQHRIDAVRYPHFAQLARDSTWFRNNNTVHGGTAGAVPAIYTGMYPRRGAYPTYGFYPRNLFTLLGGTYRLRVGETITHLCPKKLCPTPLFKTTFRSRMKTLSSDVAVVFAHLVVPDTYESRLPSLALSWTDFRQRSARKTGRLKTFLQFIDTIQPSRVPTLNLIHIELPHAPFVFLPSCREYASNVLEASGLGEGGDVWQRNWLATQQYQRHLLQLQCTDRLLGRLIARMRQVGIYDRSLLIVTADEGESFRPGDHRRAVTSTNLADIAFVPLFVKRPGQRQGAIVDRHVQGVDILPTIAEVLGITIPWPVDGVSVFRPGHPARIHLGYSPGLARPFMRRLLPARDQTLRRQLGLFGSGRSGPGLYGVGPHPELVGKQLASLRVVDSAGARGSISGELVPLLRSLAPDSDIVPTPIVGTVEGAGIQAGAPVTVAVNGRIAAVGRTYGARSGVGYSLLAPGRSFHAGRNTVQVFLIAHDRTGVSLRPIIGASV